MRDLLVDVRSGLRQIIRQRTSSFVAIITLALGIGVTAAVFSVADATLLRPLPFQNPEELVSVDIEDVYSDGRVSRAMPSMREMRATQDSGIFSFVAGTGAAFGGRIRDTEVPERIRVMHFTEDYLPMLGITPILGRGVDRTDCEPSAPLVALLGYGYWQSRYGGRPDVLGQTIRLTDDSATIVGVLPRGFNDTFHVSTPLRVPLSEYERRGTGRVSIRARLAPGITVDEASARLSGADLGPRVKGVAYMRARVVSQLDALTSQYRMTVLVFLGAVALILVLAAVNVAGLMLARGSARQTELAVRTSLGAGRWRLIRQLFVESVALAVPATAFGLLLAWLTLDAIVSIVPMTMPANTVVALDFRVVAMTASVLLPATLLFGLWPALQLCRQIRVTSLMARGARQLGSPLTRRGGQALIASEVALAVVLVVGAGLMIRSFARLSDVELGFDLDDLVTMEIMPLDRNASARQTYFDELLSRVHTLPGVTSAGVVDNLALSNNALFTTVSAGTRNAPSAVFQATPGYLESLRVTLRQGRLLSPAEYQAGYRGVVINESAARTLFAESPAVGGQITRRQDDLPWTVLGVIRDLRHDGPIDVRRLGQAQVFFPFSVRDDGDRLPRTLVVRRAPASTITGEQLRQTARGIGPPVLIERIRTGEDWFTDRVLTPRRRMMLLGLLGTLGLTLALVGVFGMTAYAVARRTPEIGIRMAFGARQSQVVATIVRDAAWPLIVGVGVGVAGALALGKTIQSFLFETAPHDPVTLAAVAVVLMVSGTVAALLPALRAASVDPVASLRTE